MSGFGSGRGFGSSSSSNRRSSGQSISGQQSSQPCVYFQRGHCNMGDQCRYRHDNPSRSHPDIGRDRVQQQQQQQQGRKTCRFFNENGECRYGDNCRYSHHDGRTERKGSSWRSSRTAPTFDAGSLTSAERTQESSKNGFGRGGGFGGVGEFQASGNGGGFDTGRGFPSDGSTGGVWGGSGFGFSRSGGGSGSSRSRDREGGSSSQGQLKFASGPTTDGGSGFFSGTRGGSNWNHGPRGDSVAETGPAMTGSLHSSSGRGIGGFRTQSFAPGFSTGATSSLTTSMEGWFTEEHEAGKEDLEAFEAERFRLGKIPEVPPPRRFCGVVS